MWSVGWREGAGAVIDGSNLPVADFFFSHSEKASQYWPIVSQSLVVFGSAFPGTIADTRNCARHRPVFLERSSLCGEKSGFACQGWAAASASLWLSGAGSTILNGKGKGLPIMVSEPITINSAVDTAFYFSVSRPFKGKHVYRTSEMEGRKKARGCRRGQSQRLRWDPNSGVGNTV